MRLFFIRNIATLRSVVGFLVFFFCSSLCFCFSVFLKQSPLSDFVGKKILDLCGGSKNKIKRRQKWVKKHALKHESDLVNSYNLPHRVAALFICDLYPRFPFVSSLFVDRKIINSSSPIFQFGVEDCKEIRSLFFSATTEQGFVFVFFVLWHRCWVGWLGGWVVGWLIDTGREVEGRGELICSREGVEIVRTRSERSRRRRPALQKH